MRRLLALIIAYVAPVLHTGVFAGAPAAGFTPRLVPLAAVTIGLLCDSRAAIVCATLLGLWADSFSTGPFGVQTVAALGSIVLAHRFRCWQLDGWPFVLIPFAIAVTGETLLAGTTQMLFQESGISYSQLTSFIGRSVCASVFWVAFVIVIGRGICGSAVKRHAA